jgi:hypothetical protein
MEKRMKELELEKRAIAHARIQGLISEKEFIDKTTKLDNEIRRLRMEKG